jgi:hypothetical protein
MLLENFNLPFVAGISLVSHLVRTVQDGFITPRRAYPTPQGLVSTSHACFGVEIAKVSAQRLLSDEQALRDLLIAEFLSKQGQDFALPATRLFVLPTLPTTIRDNEMIGRMMGLRR